MSHVVTQTEPDIRPVSENKKLLFALSGILLSILLASLDQTIVSPAMPRVVEELKGFSLFACVSTAYLLTSTAMIPIAGKLGDMFGRKWCLVVAAFLTLVGVVMQAAASGNLGPVYAGRAIAGMSDPLLRLLRFRIPDPRFPG